MAAAVLALIGGTGGHAADLHGGMKGSPMLPEPPAESSKPINWTALYIGGQVGYGNSNHNVNGQGYHGLAPWQPGSS